MSSPIEDYALIGDGQTAALVNRNGSIDWLCWPRFDSDACFCALLGTHENGRWLLAPEAHGRTIQRRYEEDTLVLETETTTDTGVVRVTDFMPIREGDLSAVVRVVDGLAGSVAMRMDLRLRFDYGAMPPWSNVDAKRLTATIGPNRVTLDSPIRIDVKNDAAMAEFVVAEGQRLIFVLRLRAFPQPHAAASRARARPRRNACLLAKLDLPIRCQPDEVVGPRQAVADHPARHGPYQDRRAGGGAHDRPSGIAGRIAQLGL